MLDASTALNGPFFLNKLILKQLASNRISICFTSFIYPTAGIKQGGILSGRLFSMCSDVLVQMLRKVGAGVLLNVPSNLRALLFSIIYADDIILVAKSPYALSLLINVTLQFANSYMLWRQYSLGANRHFSIFS